MQPPPQQLHQAADSRQPQTDSRQPQNRSMAFSTHKCIKTNGNSPRLSSVLNQATPTKDDYASLADRCKLPSNPLGNPKAKQCKAQNKRCICMPIKASCAVQTAGPAPPECYITNSTSNNYHPL
jgi:hypothetical protein